MNRRCGIIFLDRSEVITGIYALNRNLRWTKLYYRVEGVDPADLIEKIADTLLFGIKLNIKDWQIISRNLAAESFKQVSEATRLKIKNLDLASEQELICQGMLNEIFT